MVKIRLSRGGANNSPLYRIVATDESRKRGGKALEVLGFWHPKKNTKKIDLKKIKDWVEKGAKITKAVEKIMAS